MKNVIVAIIVIAFLISLAANIELWRMETSVEWRPLTTKERLIAFTLLFLPTIALLLSVYLFFF